MSLTQYLESQENQDMIRLLYFTKTWERGREEVSLLDFFLGGGGGEVYIVVVKKIYMEGHLMRVEKGLKRIMNQDPISDFGES